MNWVGEQMLGYGRIFPIAEIKRRLRGLVPGDLRSVARHLFQPQRLNLALVSPVKSCESLKPLLRI
jgi:hypothetical protein